MSRKSVRDPFLTEAQLAVFKEFDVPVRYIRGWRRYLGEKCKYCEKPAVTAAHHIPYRKGIMDYGLRPDFLNERWNLVATCRRHNKKAEWNDARIASFVARLRGGSE